MNTEIKLMSGKDFLNIAELEKDFYDESKVALINASTLYNSEKVFYIMADGQITGFAGILKKRLLPQFFIVVRSSSQGMGIGTLLTNAAINYSLIKYKFIYLSTYNNGAYDSAIKIYKNLGFRIVDSNNDKLTMFISKGCLGFIKRIFLLLTLFFYKRR